MEVSQYVNRVPLSAILIFYKMQSFSIPKACLSHISRLIPGAHSPSPSSPLPCKVPCPVWLQSHLSSHTLEPQPHPCFNSAIPKSASTVHSWKTPLGSFRLGYVRPLCPFTESWTSNHGTYHILSPLIWVCHPHEAVGWAVAQNTLTTQWSYKI